MDKRSSIYKIPFTLALLLHIALLLFLLVKLPTSKQPVLQNTNANIVHAVAMNSVSLPQQLAKLKTLEQQKLNHVQEPPEPIKPPQPDLAKQEQLKQEQREQAQLRTEQQQKQLADQRAAAEKLKQQEAEKQHLAVAEQQRKEKLEQAKAEKEKELAAKKAQEEKKLAAAKQAQEAKKKAAEQKQLAQAKKLQEQAEKLLQQQMEAEQQQIDSAMASQMQGVVDKYKALILQAIGQQWLVPENADKNLFCKLLIRLAPGGMVLDVKLVKGSGDSAFDRSAIAAVYKASPLPVPSETQVFDKFRELSLTVKPESV